MTELHVAVKNGDLNECHELIEHGADVNAKDSYGTTPLNEGASYGYLEICELLIEHGADVNATNKYGVTPLHSHWASDPEICRLLIEHGADIHAKTKEGETPLHGYARRGYLEICQLLIEHGADVNAKNKWGRTPLYRIIYDGDHLNNYENIEICQLLVEKGADVPETLESTLFTLMRRSWHLTLNETNGRIEDHIQTYQLYSQFLDRLTIRPFVYSMAPFCVRISNNSSSVFDLK